MTSISHQTFRFEHDAEDYMRRNGYRPLRSTVWVHKDVAAVASLHRNDDGTLRIVMVRK